MITADKTKNKDLKKIADNPKRLADYLLYGSEYKKENELQRILCKGTFNCATDNIVEAANIVKLLNDRYNSTASSRSKNKLRTHHLIISLNAGEHLTFEQWNDVAYQHLKTLKLEDHIAFWAVHKDTDNEHMHLVFSVVNPKTLKINCLSNDRKKLQLLDSKLEEKYLIQKDNHNLTHLGEESLALDLEAKTAQQSLFTYLNEIKPKLDLTQSWMEFFDVLNKYGVECKTLGRGIIFSVQDPEDLNNNLYIKGSAFNSNGIRMSLKELEKRFGPYNSTYIFDQKKIISRYTASPVNFNLDNQNDFLNIAFNEYNQYKVEEREKNKELEKRLQKLNYEYLSLLKSERKKYNQQKALIKKAYSLHEKEMLNHLEDALTDYKNKKDYLKKRKQQIDEKLKSIFANEISASNFLDYLKRGVIVGIKKERNLLLLLSRKESQKQNHRNYISGPRVKIIKENSVADTMMYVKAEKYFDLHKVTGKGQIIMRGTHRANIGDFIKDDGLKLMCNEHPSSLTVQTISNMCRHHFIKNATLLCHGTPEFQRQFLEFSLKKDFQITFYGNKELNKEYERRKTEHKLSSGNREKLREYSRKRKGQQHSSFRRTSEFIGGRAKPVANIRRFRITEQDSSARDEKTQQQYNSSNRNIVTNAEQFNVSGRDWKNNAKSQSGMRNMSELPLAAEQQRTSVLLSDDKRDSMGERTSREILPGVRWEISDQQQGGGKQLEKNSTVVELLKQFEERQETKDQIVINENEKIIPQEVAEYINERNDKHDNGYKDVLEHELYSDQTGKFVYKGLRRLSENTYALLEQNKKIFLKKVDDYALSRLKQTKRGTQIEIDQKGRIINRNKYFKRN